MKSYLVSGISEWLIHFNFFSLKGRVESIGECNAVNQNILKWKFDGNDQQTNESLIDVNAVDSTESETNAKNSFKSITLEQKVLEINIYDHAEHYS